MLSPISVMSGHSPTKVLGRGMSLNLKESTSDWLVCNCGNTPHSDGFDTCLDDGTIVYPFPDEWDGVHYVCLRCKAVYNVDTMEEVSG